MSEASGGSHGLEGLVYQALVSVWVALDLLVVNQRTERIELEPASQEDLEAELRDDEAPPKAGTAAQTSSYRLRVQVKFTSGEPWDLARFRALVKHGSANRQSAREQLSADPGSRYLLITNNAVVNKLRELEVTAIGVWPEDGALPAFLDSPDGSVPDDLSSRLAIVGNCTYEYLSWKIKSHLTSDCHVPLSRCVECLTSLHHDAIARMRPSADHTWRRSDLEEVIQRFGGYLSASREEAEYVKPQNWSTMVDRLERNHAIIIKGESGTGKTSAARALLAHLRTCKPGIEVKNVFTPNDIREHSRRPVAFYLDDPWGKSRFEPHSTSWKNELTSNFQNAGPDCYFIVTTRSDIYQTAALGEKHKRWITPLESSHYEPRDRYAMYRNRMKTVPKDFQALVADMRGSVLKQLQSPYEIDQFFSNLIGLEFPDDRQDWPRLIEHAATTAHLDAVQDNIREQVSKRDASVAATVLWGVLAVCNHARRDFLRRVHTRISQLAPGLTHIKLDELVSFFAAGTSLKASDDSVSYGHPRVEAALESLVAADPVPAQAVLRTLSQGMYDLFVHGRRENAPEMLAKLSAALPQDIDKLVVFERTHADAMNEWLVARCLEGGPTFQDHLGELERSGMPGFAPSEVARFLTDGGVYHVFGADTFDPFVPTDEWLSAASSDPRTPALCASFIIGILPVTHYEPQDNFFELLERIAGDQTPAFLEALTDLVVSGHRSTHFDLILEHAARDLNGLKAVAEQALHAYQLIDFSVDEDQAIAIEDNYYGSEHGEGPPNWWESAQVASGVIERFVEKSRERLGWRVLSLDPSLQGMEPWLVKAAAVSARGGAAADPSEVAHLWDRMAGTPHEGDFWEVVPQLWSNDFAEPLISRVLNRETAPGVRCKAIACGREVDGGGLLARAVSRLAAVGAWSGVLDLLSEIRGNSHWDEQFSLIAFVTALDAVANPHRLMLASVLNGTPLPEVSNDTFAGFLAGLSPTTEAALLALVQAMVRCQRDPINHVRRLLKTCEGGTCAAQAVLVARTFVPVSELQSATLHGYGKVRAAALESLCLNRHPQRLQELMRMTDDRSWYVKEAVARIAGEDAREFKAVLKKQLGDTWTEDHWASGDDHQHLPIARLAAKALAALNDLDNDDVEDLFFWAQFCRDADVRLKLFKLIVKNGSTRHRKLLIEICIAPEAELCRPEVAAALGILADHIEPELAAAIELRHLLELDAFVAVRLARMVGARLDAEVASTYAESLRGDAERRVLLLALGFGAAGRPQLRAAVTGMLPTAHPALGVFSPAKADIPPECLSELGGHQEVRAIRRAFKNWFMEEAH
ncbi:hypothetical protein [Mitsuaria sp. 7]|uniref:nSTAND3 domain-containing NTPase n=1 Tax=Mitsuaria sp. 7 TaxID=1658665 RepID=UPI0007DDDA4B|nr:hypothetical protein [Mitsuaria sp. 7]ANH66624.1 hypothetical protein ABE85_01895 [Mitsuaria sp. 7]